MSNNLRNLVAIANENATTVHGVFFNGEKQSQEYMFKIPLSIAKPENTTQLLPGDLLLVDTARGITCIRVTKVDEFADISPDSPIEYKWAFARVDKTPLEALIKEEDQQVAELVRLRRQHIRQQVVEAVRSGKNPSLLFNETTSQATPAEPVKRRGTKASFGPNWGDTTQDDF